MQGYFNSFMFGQRGQEEAWSNIGNIAVFFFLWTTKEDMLVFGCLFCISIFSQLQKQLPLVTINAVFF